jgi:hypothetical protein
VCSLVKRCLRVDKHPLSPHMLPSDLAPCFRSWRSDLRGHVPQHLDSFTTAEVQASKHQVVMEHRVSNA